jgi:hypothetical protein
MFTLLLLIHDVWIPTMILYVPFLLDEFATVPDRPLAPNGRGMLDVHTREEILRV